LWHTPSLTTGEGCKRTMVVLAKYWSPQLQFIYIVMGCRQESNAGGLFWVHGVPYSVLECERFVCLCDFLSLPRNCRELSKEGALLSGCSPPMLPQHGHLYFCWDVSVHFLWLFSSLSDFFLRIFFLLVREFFFL